MHSSVKTDRPSEPRLATGNWEIRANRVCFHLSGPHQVSHPKTIHLKPDASRLIPIDDWSRLMLCHVSPAWRDWIQMGEELDWVKKSAELHGWSVSVHYQDGRVDTDPPCLPDGRATTGEYDKLPPLISRGF